MSGQWYQRMDETTRQAFLEEMGRLKKKRRQRLRELGVPRSTYYYWKNQEQQGTVIMKKEPRRMWNEVREEELEVILREARNHPELSCRLLAVKITDEMPFSLSESTVYRVLKANNLIVPRPLPEMPASDQWRHKTTHPDEIWQCDATHYFIVGWGFYKQISVMDDYSRRILAWVLKPDETAFSISEAVEDALENARFLGHLNGEERPTFLSDNGSGFVATMLGDYLAAHGIKHIFGKPYHPQTQGKIERFHRKIKERVCLMVYCAPGELERALNDAIPLHNRTPHKSLNNVNPDDVYAGRKEKILQKRREKKQLTLEARKRYNYQRNHRGQLTLRSMSKNDQSV